MEEDYDVVIDVLTKHRDNLYKINQSTIDMRGPGIMDQIRFDHIDEIEEAIKWWKQLKESGWSSGRS